MRYLLSVMVLVCVSKIGSGDIFDPFVPIFFPNEVNEVHRTHPSRFAMGDEVIETPKERTRTHPSPIAVDNKVIETPMDRTRFLFRTPTHPSPIAVDDKVIETPKDRTRTHPSPIAVDDKVIETPKDRTRTHPSPIAVDDEVIETPKDRTRTRTSPVDDENSTMFANQVNAITSIKDFAAFFNIDLTEETITSRFGNTGDEGVSGGKVLEQAKCIPEPTTVELDITQMAGVSHYPTCVRLNRCGGCCFLPHYSCQPTETEIVDLKVLNIDDKVVKSPNRRRRAGEQQRVQAFIVVEAEQHIACECRCRLQASACNLEIQTYNQNICDCQCKNTEEEKECYTKPTHFWSADSCRCLCRKQHGCNTGMTFRHDDTCSCQ